jgi:small subunit ribosomal protein S8
MNADPIADMLTRIRNANALHYDTVSMPYSKMKDEIAEILRKEGYIVAVAIDGEGAKKELNLTSSTVRLAKKSSPDSENLKPGLTRHRGS